MKEKHFIAIIVLILVFGFVFYAIGNVNLSPSTTNGNNESLNSIWVTSKNVECVSDGDGTHMKGTNDKACWSALKYGDKQLFINSNEDFTIEFDAKIGNMLAMYFVTSEESNGDIFIVPKNSSDFQHIQFNYSSSNNNLTYSANGNVVKTIDCKFQGKPVGFKIIDWQGDMDIVVRNIFVVNS